MAKPTRRATYADVYVNDDTLDEMFTMLPPGNYRSVTYEVSLGAGHPPARRRRHR